jgi:hypothetical protein
MKIHGLSFVGLVLVAASQLAGCGGADARNGTPDSIDSTAQTLDVSVPASEATLAQSNVAKWNLKFDRKATSTVEALDAKGARVGLWGIRLIAETGGVEIVQSGTGGGAVTLDRDGKVLSNTIVHSSLKTLGLVDPDIRSYSDTHPAAYGCGWLWLITIATCAVAAVEVGANIYADASCGILLAGTVDACVGD